MAWDDETDLGETIENWPGRRASDPPPKHHAAARILVALGEQAIRIERLTRAISAANLSRFKSESAVAASHLARVQAEADRARFWTTARLVMVWVSAGGAIALLAGGAAALRMVAYFGG